MVGGASTDERRASLVLFTAVNCVRVSAVGETGFESAISADMARGAKRIYLVESIGPQPAQLPRRCNGRGKLGAGWGGEGEGEDGDDGDDDGEDEEDNDEEELELQSSSRFDRIDAMRPRLKGCERGSRRRLALTTK